MSPPTIRQGRRAAGDRAHAERPRRARVGRGRPAGLDRFFVVADSWSIPTGVGVAGERVDKLAGLVLTHASITHSIEGERPSVSPEVYAVITQLIRQHAPAFVRHGITQVTGGSVDEDMADRILERLPTDDMLKSWEILTTPVDYADQLLGLDCPMLLVKHEGCLMNTEEGVRGCRRGPARGGRTAAVPEAPPVSREFAEALRRFCLAHG